MLKITCFTPNKDKAMLENILLLIESESDEKRIAIFREFNDFGEVHCKGWPILNQEDYDNCMLIVKNQGLNESFVVDSPDSENANVITNIFRHTLLPGPFHKVISTSIAADFWSAAQLRANRPQSYGESVDIFTFDALKEMWKSIGKSGFSSKSKSDLYEGFAESASDIATSPESEEFCNQLPARMIQLENNYHTTYMKPNTTIMSPTKVLALTSRISGKVLYNKESSPEITNDTIRNRHIIVDLIDPYKDPIESGFTTEQEALAALTPIPHKE
jgi:hypothetical protein